MNKHLSVFSVLLCSLLLASPAWADADIEINTAAVNKCSLGLIVTAALANAYE